MMTRLRTVLNALEPTEGITFSTATGAGGDCDIR